MFLYNRSSGCLRLHDIFCSQFQLLLNQNWKIDCFNWKKLTYTGRLLYQVLNTVIEHIRYLLIKSGMSTITGITGRIVCFCLFPLLTLFLKSSKELILVCFHHSLRLYHHGNIGKRIDLFSIHCGNCFCENIIKVVTSFGVHKTTNGSGFLKYFAISHFLTGSYTAS